jgi:hypothetical protein
MNSCRWKIENGTKLKVMGEPWLREENGLWMQAPQLQAAYDITLNNILLPNLKRWGKEKIESIFPLDITNRILKVVDNDQLVWYYDNHGCYSVKSGYNLLIKLTGRGEVLTARRIGIQYGKFMHLQKLNISFGEFVKDVCRPVAA